MKKIIRLITAIILVACLIDAIGCSKSGNTTGQSHLFIVTDCTSEFTTQYTTNVQLIKGSTLIAQNSNQGTGKDTVDLGVISTGTYTVSTSSYRVSGGSSVPPVYSYNGSVNVTDVVQYVVVVPH